MKILIVDDEPMQLNSMKLGLRVESHMVVMALSGKEALDELKNDPGFDLIITDHLMPEINGLELIKAVHERQLSIPFILMTAYAKKDLVVEALQNQCAGFIEKPFSLDQLLAEIKRVANLKRHDQGPAAFKRGFAKIAHQINNPLAAIRGNAEFALHCNSDPISLRRNLRNIIKATGMISELNRKIFGMEALLHDGNIKENIDMQWLLSDCLDMFESLMSLRGMTHEKKIDGKDLVIFGNRFSLQQAFRNLIMNAIQAMENRERKTLRVTAERDRTNSSIVIHIDDTGCGIPQSFGTNIFKPGWTTKKDGSGLGLHVVKEVIEHHQGRLLVQSQEEAGTSVTVFLPGIDAQPGLKISEEASSKVD